ncbi:MAG: hypothetical protein JWQ40_4194 [Segetibacter sp.]|nr:hypothetical protein [Segetibacter sp.]
MTFKASLDRLAKGVTISVSILFAIIIGVEVFIYWSKWQLSEILTSLFLIAVYLATYFYRPINYDLTDENLVIHRPFNNVIIKRKNIKSVKSIDKDQMKWTIRTLGVGGFFGYYGQFVNSQLGNMTWYATRQDKTVLIETNDNKKLVVTPDEPEEFIKQLSV